MAEDGQDPGLGRGRLKRLAQVASVAFIALALVFVVHTLVRDWPKTDEALQHANLAYLVPAAASALAAMLFLAWRWGAAIAAVGGRPLRSARVISAFFVGEAGKYIPGAVWAMLGRGELARREGYERSVAYSSVALSVIGCYLAATVTALVLAVVALTNDSIAMPWWPVALVAVAGVAALHPAVSRRILTLGSRIAGRTLTVEIPSWTRCLRLTGSYIPVWILIAAATTLITRSLTDHPPIVRVGLAAVVSWIIGFITPSPGGLGVREAVFIAIAGVAAGPAAAAAIVARVLFVLVDVLGAGVGWTVLRVTEPSGGLVSTEGRTA
jgi:uncharacterized membrane protein YbhN (UPF0104 family)